MSKSDIKNSIDDCLRCYKLIYNLLDLHTNDNEYGFYYKGNKVISFYITNDQIIYKNKILNYIFVKKDAIKNFLKECINEGIDELNECITVIDMITDVKHYSNNTWEFNIDIENKSIVITLNYIIPYYDAYIKRVSANKSVNVSNMFNDDFHFTDYHKEVKEFLNNRIAPAMESLINEVVQSYNTNHITSALCKKSETKSVNKGGM
jgi:hypothetical protein